ncbi:hypothetical protein CTAYLR_004232 [Chrysophaeum taylorii]|uniref:Mitochondrial carrier protein n=1 Tax=Chrysophaeum taylorii TaxID=2483200 RepID=A0AAD7UE45_9STRA|nr:hypothetical protein CTAYLR_004232 [Chrysophaeum taylorii]
MEEDRQASPQRRDTRVSFDPSLSGGDMAVDDDDDDDEGLDEVPELIRTVRKERWWATLIAGGVAGAVSRTCVAPLERMKILFQVRGLSTKDGAPRRHLGVLESLVNMYQKDGLLGFWKGNGLNCIRVVPSSAIQFSAYALYKRLFFGDDGTVHLSSWQHVVAGGLAGATSTTLTYPLDLIRARRTVDFKGDVPTGLISGLAHVFRHEGIAGAFRGIVPSLCGIVPYIGIDFAVYDLLKRSCRHRAWGLDPANPHDLRPQTKVLCGAVAGVCGMTVAFPFDTARRNLQVATLKVRGEGYPTNMLQIMGSIVREGGVLALYRGLVPNYLKAGPSVGISFATFEYVKARLDDLAADPQGAQRR